MLTLTLCCEIIESFRYGNWISPGAARGRARSQPRTGTFHRCCYFFGRTVRSDAAHSQASPSSGDLEGLPPEPPARTERSRRGAAARIGSAPGHTCSMITNGSSQEPLLVRLAARHAVIDLQ